ncbi:aspartate carbamoyltransferase [Neomoorella humiferrea]|uniref:Aspartate carbamoyltransferase n=1 Tax=Neomoorella humiferrea TaxID=676965 RepID=A0A2T0AQR8_9FIRM|nr:aspartate carbamoyltransferase [Moorella humiferrea]PRR71327.1 Aspartate carbamoyltransferase catalytic chain [Moorella humiferrea]
MLQKPTPEEMELLKGQDVLSARDLSFAQLQLIMKTAAYYEDALVNKRRLYDMDGKIMASLFFEPSTRTRLSFEAAMQRLGGNVITVSETPQMQTSSTAKGETLHDAIKVVDGYVDVIVVRSPIKGAAQEAAEAAEHPVINAGDGTGQHPTQALLDIYTIIKEHGHVEGMKVALLGDLKYGRTVHSLVYLLKHYGCDMIFVSPPQLKMPEEITNELKQEGIKVEETADLKAAVAEADILYVTRIQRERFPSQEEYESVKDSYIVNDEIVAAAKKGMSILHPLPRVNEIAVSVDTYAGAAYFRQAHNGVPIRMALLALTTGNVR